MKKYLSPRDRRAQLRRAADNADVPVKFSPKATNPKDLIGSTKLPLGLVPDAVIAYAALSFMEGALKYGRYNWRVAGVSSAIYHDALKRHLAKWWNGEDADPKTRVPHLASIIACAGILLDAALVGKLNDTRPPRSDGTGKFIDDMDSVVAHLKATFVGHNPYQYTIADSERVVPVLVDMAACHSGPPEHRCDKDGPGGFMGHTCGPLTYRHTGIVPAGTLKHDYKYGKPSKGKSKK